MPLGTKDAWAGWGVHRAEFRSGTACKGWDTLGLCAVCFGTFQESAMRFEVKWANGHWIIFDNVSYSVARFAGTRKEIDRIYEFG